MTYYEHDHLGNLRVAFTPVVDCNNPTGTAPDPLLNHATSSFTLEHVVDYFPYGKILRQYVNSNGPERYLTTQHERDQETGLDYRGARYYDSDVARFLSLDPAQTEYPSWSPYNYVMGNPISLIDPTGKNAWKPDSKGDLIAEAGDNICSLSEFMGVTHNEAQKLACDQGYDVTDRDGSYFNKGDKVRLDNVFTRSIERSEAGLIKPYGLFHMSNADDYNCWGSAVSGTQGKEIFNGCGFNFQHEADFDGVLQKNYTSVRPEFAKFGKTAIRFEKEHGAVFYG